MASVDCAVVKSHRGSGIRRKGRCMVMTEEGDIMKAGSFL